MNTLTRKQREIQEREALILKVARDMLLEKGYLGLTMEKIAAEVEYSKGTIYQHFSSKEDVLVALAAQTKEKRVELFERGATFNGRSRERITAVGLADHIFIRLYPQHARSEQTIHAASIHSKAAQERLMRVENLDFRCFQVVAGIIRDAAAHGDLDLGNGRRAEDLAYGLWSISFGANFIEASSASMLATKGIDDPAAALARNQQALLDGYGWAPLSHGWDYEASRRRILEEVFFDEAQRAHLL